MTSLQVLNCSEGMLHLSHVKVSLALRLASDAFQELVGVNAEETYRSKELRRGPTFTCKPVQTWQTRLFSEVLSWFNVIDAPHLKFQADNRYKSATYFYGDCRNFVTRGRIRVFYGVPWSIPTPRLSVFPANVLTWEQVGLECPWRWWGWC